MYLPVTVANLRNLPISVDADEREKCACEVTVFTTFLRNRMKAKGVSTWSKSSRASFASRVRDYASHLSTTPDAELQHRSNDLRDVAALSADVLQDSILVAGLGLIVESVRRQMGYLVFDVQVDAAVALASGQIVEMQTG